MLTFYFYPRRSRERRLASFQKFSILYHISTHAETEYALFNPTQFLPTPLLRAATV